MKYNRAVALRAMIEKASASLSDTDALEALELFPEWATQISFVQFERVRYNGKLYRCEQAHTRMPDWTPDVTPAQDSYMTGDKVHYPTKNDAVYESTMDYNTYAPDTYGWRVI